MVSIVVNGQPRAVSPGTKVTDLLAEMKVTARHCAVEINLQLVPRSEHADRELVEGDHLEIVTLVGGG
jgi:sulfur carrier protein